MKSATDHIICDYDIHSLPQDPRSGKFYWSHCQLRIITERRIRRHVVAPITCIWRLQWVHMALNSVSTRGGF